METSRRSFLLGTVSTGALVAAGWPLAEKAIPMAGNLLEALYEPGAQAMAAAVHSVVTLLHPMPFGVDLSDMRTVLEGGGRAGFGQGVRFK